MKHGLGSARRYHTVSGVLSKELPRETETFFPLSQQQSNAVVYHLERNDEYFKAICDIESRSHAKKLSQRF